jgi:hypothetical protein
MIITGNIYKIRAMVGNSPQDAIFVMATDMESATKEAILHATDQPGNKNKDITILESTGVALENL